MAYLRRRFQALKPDEAGLIDRSVFQHPPYSIDPYCRQVRPEKFDRDTRNPSFISVSLYSIFFRYGSAFLVQRAYLIKSPSTNTPNQ